MKKRLIYALTIFWISPVLAEVLTQALPDYDLASPELVRPAEPIGAPSLPYAVVGFDMPSTLTVGEIVVSGDWVPLAGEPEAIQEDYPLDEDPHPYVKDAALFAERWPKVMTENLGFTTCSGVDTLQIKVTPFRWQAGKLEALRNGKVEVDVEGVIPRRRVKLASEVARPRYVLISPSAYTNDWAGYLEMRAKQRPDVDFILKNAAEIYETYPFVAGSTDGTPRNPAESIHRFIREDHADHGTKYYVLGGSFVNAQSVTDLNDARLTTKMPGIICTPRNSPGDANPPYDYSPVSDMFYSCLDMKNGQLYPWDANGNGRYIDNNEIGNDQNDFVSDVVVSRIPLKSSRLSEKQVIAAFKAKVRRIEGDDENGTNASFAGAYRMASAGGKVQTEYTSSSGYFLRDEREFYDGGLNHFDPRHSGRFFDAEVVPRNTLKNIVRNRRPVLEGNPLFQYCWGAEHPTFSDAVNAYFSKDYDYCEYRDHGSSLYLYGQFITRDRYLAATGVTRIIMSGFSCSTACIDGNDAIGYTAPTLGEAEIVSERGGAMANVHNSRTGLAYSGMAMKDSDGLSSTLQYNMKVELINNDCDIGTAWMKARQSYAPGHTGGAARKVMVEQLLMGDPLARLSPAIPAATWGANENVTIDRGFTTLTASTGAIASSKLVKVMNGMTIEGEGDFTFAADGGVGGTGVTFSGEGDHNLVLASPTKGYFPLPTGAKDVKIAGSGITLDLEEIEEPKTRITSLTLDGGVTRKTGNVIRGRKTGQLKGFLPMTIKNTEVLFATAYAFNNHTVSDCDYTVENGLIGITQNPQFGMWDTWEHLSGTMLLKDSTIRVEGTTSAGFGQGETGLTVDVRGNGSVETTEGGRIALFDTTTFNVAEDAVLTLNANIDPRSGKIVINNSGRVVIAENLGLAGDVTINGGTVEIATLPLQNVKKLTLTNGVKLVLPKDEGGFYQILPPQNATLTHNNTPVFVKEGEEEMSVSGQYTATCSYFDVSAFLVWNNRSGGDWTTNADRTPWKLGTAAASYTAGAKVYFPDVPMGVSGSTIPINLLEEINCDFANFGNQSQKYAFSGQRLNLKNVQIGTDVTFNNTVYASAGALITGGNLVFANLNTPKVEVANGGTLSATQLSSDLSTIKAVRLYILETHNQGTYCAISELKMYNSAGEVNLKGAAHGESSDIAKSSNWGYLYDGNCAGIDFAFNGEKAWSVTVPDANDFASGRYYMQFDFSTAIPRITSLKIATTYANQQTSAVKKFRVDVSVDGESWVTVAAVDNTTIPNSGYNELWMKEGSFAVGGGLAPSEVSVAEGGAYALSGSPTARIAFADGAMLKVSPGAAMNYSAQTTFVYPSEGTIRVSVPSGVTAQQILKNCGKTFTFEDLAHFEASEGYYLSVDDAGLTVNVGTPLAGPYTLIAGGRQAWADAPWEAYDETGTNLTGFAWNEATLNPIADVELVATNDTVITISDSVSFNTLRQKDVSMSSDLVAAGSLRLEKAEAATINALTYDLSGFDDKVTIAFSTGRATVIAGANTHLRGNGTGKLVVDAGMTVTIYQASWNGTIENNGGTVIYRGALPTPKVLFR